MEEWYRWLFEPAVISTMNTQNDIRHDEEIDIAVNVINVEEWDHDAIARKIQLEDIEGNNLELTVFHNNESAEFEWEIGEWYQLDNAVGNEYNDEMQLNPGYDLKIDCLESAPVSDESDYPGDQYDSTDSESVSTDKFEKQPQPAPDGSGEILQQQPLTEGNYLLHFELGELPELTVYEYELRSVDSGGIDPEDFTNGIEGFTAKAANYYRSRINSPVTSADAARRRIYATEKLQANIRLHGYTIKPVPQGRSNVRCRESIPFVSLHRSELQLAGCLKRTGSTSAVFELMLTGPSSVA